MATLRLLLIVSILAAAIGALVPSAAIAAGPPVETPVKLVIVEPATCALDMWWCVFEQGIWDAAKQLNVELTVIAPEKVSPEQTAEDMDKAIALQPDGIGGFVFDGALSEPGMMRAINAGIPLIVFSGGDERPKEERIPYVLFLGQDEYNAGYMAGERLLKAHPEAKRGVCLNEVIGNVGMNKRCQGFKDALATAGIESETLAVTLDPSETVTIVGDYFTRNPDTNVWLTLGQSPAAALYSFFEREGYEAGKDMFHGTIDLGPEITTAIKDGKTDFAVDQLPYVQGYMTVQWLTWIKRFGMYPATDFIPCGPAFITKDTLGKVEEFAGTYR